MVFTRASKASHPKDRITGYSRAAVAVAKAAAVLEVYYASLSVAEAPEAKTVAAAN